MSKCIEKSLRREKTLAIADNGLIGLAIIPSVAQRIVVWTLADEAIDYRYRNGFFTSLGKKLPGTNTILPLETRVMEVKKVGSSWRAFPSGETHANMELTCRSTADDGLSMFQA